MWSPDSIVSSCETVTLLSVAGPPTSNTTGKRLTVNDDRAGFALTPQSIADALEDGPGRRAGVRRGTGTTPRPAASSRSAADRTSTARGRRAARRSSRRGRRELRLPACLALSRVGVHFLTIVASREHVAGEAAQRVNVVVEEDQNNRIDGGVRPRQERQQLIDFRRLLELRIDEGQDVERIPGEDEEYGDQNEDT